MKRIFALFVVFLLVILTCACSMKKSRIVISSMDDGDLFNTVVSEGYSLSTEFKQIEGENKIYEAEINGNTYVGRYKHSLISPYYNCDMDIYTYNDDNGPDVEFRINRATGKLVDYAFLYKEEDPLQSGNKSYDECYQIALNELEKRLNGTEFVLIDSEENRTCETDPGIGDYYYFSFEKKLGDAHTNVIVWMNVYTNGVIWIYSSNLTPSLDSSEDHRAVIKAYNDPASLNLIDKKIRSICSGDHDPDKLSWTVEEQYVSKLKSGEECVQYQVVVTEEGSDVPNCIRLLLIP